MPASSLDAYAGKGGMKGGRKGEKRKGKEKGREAGKEGGRNEGERKDEKVGGRQAEGIEGGRRRRALTEG